MRPSPDPSLVVYFCDEIDRWELPGVCARVRAFLLSIDARMLVCDFGAVADPDAVTLDVLARLQLTAGRLGRVVELRSACAGLDDLIEFAGLSAVVGVVPEPPTRAEEAGRRAGTTGRCPRRRSTR
jgi:hypothetical protein